MLSPSLIISNTFLSYQNILDSYSYILSFGSLKFTSAEGIQIPKSTFVLRGDSFRSQIFISANDTTQDPLIYVGAYDSLGVGKYQMIGDYDTIKVVNGKGISVEEQIQQVCRIGVV